MNVLVSIGISTALTVCGAALTLSDLQNASRPALDRAAIVEGDLQAILAACCSQPNLATAQVLVRRGDGRWMMTIVCRDENEAAQNEDRMFVAFDMALRHSAAQTTWEEARMFYAKTAKAFLDGGMSEDSRLLMFNVGPLSATADPDKPASSRE